MTRPTRQFPSWCCQSCGDEIGWIGRFLGKLGICLHDCRPAKPYCCDEMKRHATLACDQHESPFDCPDVLVYRAENGGHSLIIHDGGTSFNPISYCPWCGTKIEGQRA